LLRPVTLVGCIVPALAQVGAIVNIEVEGMAVPDAARKRLKRQSALESLGKQSQVASRYLDCPKPRFACGRNSTRRARDRKISSLCSPMDDRRSRSTP